MSQISILTAILAQKTEVDSSLVHEGLPETRCTNYRAMNAEYPRKAVIRICDQAGDRVLETYDYISRKPVNVAGFVVITKEYRLPSEHAFPTPLDDCYKALNWVTKQATQLTVSFNAA